METKREVKNFFKFIKLESGSRSMHKLSQIPQTAPMDTILVMM